MTKPFKLIKKLHAECPECEEERELDYGETVGILKVRGIDIEVPSKIYYCSAGDHYFYSLDDEEEKFIFAYREYKAKKKLLQSEEIKAIRAKYGLSQRNFARLLGWSEATIHRYESGAIQDDSHNGVLMLMRNFDNFKEYFEAKRNALNPTLVELVQASIDLIEKQQRGFTVELIINMSKEREKEKPFFAMQSALNYQNELDDQEYSANRELALAA